MAAVTRALLVVLLLAAPLLPVAPAAGTTAEWWGNPSGMLDGWHIRVPVAVKNPGTRDLHNAVVGHDLDLSTALLEAGWTSGKQGAARRLQAFELDERSLRVLEYTSLDPASPSYGVLLTDPERPVDVRYGFLDRTGGYNNRTQPDLHVEWVAEGRFAPGATRYFMIYADIKANGDKGPVAYDADAWAPLESQRWVARGTTLVGRATLLQIVGLEDDTTALVEAYAGGRPVPITAGSGSSFTNPMRLNKGQQVVLDLSTTTLLVRIRSDKPVVAADGTVGTGFIPSTDGTLLGRSFSFGARFGAAIITTQGTARITVEPGGESFEVPPQSVRVLPGEAMVRHVKSDTPILLQAWPHGLARHQLATPNGAPIGARLVGYPFHGVFSLSTEPGGPGEGGVVPPGRAPCTSSNQGVHPGELLVAAFEGEAWFRGRDFLTGNLFLPRGDAGAPAQTSARATGTLPWRGAVDSVTNPCPFVFHSAPPEGVDFLPTGSLLAFGGQSASRVVGTGMPIGGRNATSFLVYEDVTVVALHNGTSVTVKRAAGTDRPIGLAQGDAANVTVTTGAWMRVEATKPVILIPDGPGGWFAGVDESLAVQRLGPADYRGYLVSIEPAGDAAEPMVGVAAPGKPATYKLIVRNLAKDARGAPVTDTVRISTTPLPDGWTATLSETAVRLGGGESREVTLTILPPAEVEEGTSVTLGVTAASDSLPAMADRLQVVTLIRARYGVDAWLDREGGPKSRTLVFEQGQQSRLTVVVKNLASVQDRILVTATPLSPEWKASFPESARELTEVELQPGEVRALQLDIRAPAEGGSQSLLDITATSLSDASAATKVTAGLRMRSDARIALDIEEAALETQPGDEARFRITFRNLGTEAVGIEFNTTGSLPPGWTRPETYVGEHVIDELEGLLPGSQTRLDLVARVPPGALRAQTANLHFVVHTIPQFVGDVVLKESADLRVIVAAQHDLRFTDATGDVVADETGLATGRVALRNLGNLDESLRVRPVDLPPDASFASPPPLQLPREGNGSLTASVRVPPTKPAGTYRADLELVADDGTTFPWRLNVTVLPRARVTLTADSPQESVAGVPTQAILEVRNDGNVPLSLPPQLVLPEGWRASWGNLTLRELPPGGAAAVPFELLVPRSAGDGRHEVRTDPQWADGAPLAWDVHTVRLRVEVLDRPSPTVRVQNDGTGDARDVVVELVEDGVPRDQVVLRRIPAGSSSLAVLVAPPGGDRDVTLRVDPVQRYGDAPQEFAVRVDGQNGVPSPLWLLVAALAVGALLRRR